MKILELKSSEKIHGQILEYFKNNEDARYIHRLHTILLKLDNKEHTCDSLGKLLGHSNRTVSSWINKVNSTCDISSLKSKKIPGRPAKINEEQLLEIKIVLQKPPEESGVSSNIWDGKSLSWYIENKYKIELKVRRCQMLFHELGFSLKRARPVVAKGDPIKKEAFKKNFKKK